MTQNKKYTTEFAEKTLTAEFSNLADQANGSVLVRYGETVVFATAVMTNNERVGIDYFPLTVDYEEKFYAAGQILGSRFIRREGKPSDEAILMNRLIDRTIRPLFNSKIRNEAQVVVMALAIDGENDPDIPAIIAASLALGTSDIPWDGPVGAIRIGYPDFKINPTYQEREKLNLDMVICGKSGKINMIEAGAQELSEDIVAQAFEKSVQEIDAIQKFQEQIIKEIGKTKMIRAVKNVNSEMKEIFKKHFYKRLEDSLFNPDKPSRDFDVENLKKEWLIGAAETRQETNGEEIRQPADSADEIFEEAINEIVHLNVIKNDKRVDGRKLNEIRPLFSAIDILPKVHGSAVFFRGGTHILSVVTLGAPGDVQLIEGMEVQTKKRFMHHYNFPPFSSGETGRMSGPGRREIGHGALAERALSAVIPPKENFPYTIRVVSESLASNGSTSMASVCASTLALMATGVPVKNPVAGIAMGIMTQGNDYKILTDIQGPEDHYGDMDFKAAGTKNGVTAIQMDIKIDGVYPEILKETLRQAKEARMKILDHMLKIIPESARDLPPQAPRIIKFDINPDKIRDVIGPGGKMINKITETTGVEIDIEQDGTIFITGENSEAANKALKIIKEITHEYQTGETFQGVISRIFEFGAMVEIAPKVEGLIHISELAPFRVNRVTDIVNIGDAVPVKIIGIDEMGRINLSLKAMDPNYAGTKSTTNSGEQPSTRFVEPRRADGHSTERRPIFNSHSRTKTTPERRKAPPGRNRRKG